MSVILANRTLPSQLVGWGRPKKHVKYTESMTSLQASFLCEKSNFVPSQKPNPSHIATEIGIIYNNFLRLSFQKSVTQSGIFSRLVKTEVPREL